MWDTINISECERSEIDNASVSTMFGTIINKNNRRGRRSVKSEKTVYLLVMWIEASESIIQDEGDELAK